MPSKPSVGHFRLLYFASATNFTQKPSDELRAPLPIKDLFRLLEQKYPGIEEAVLSSSAVTVNLNYIDIEEASERSEPMLIHEGDEVAIIPPVSSG